MRSAGPVVADYMGTPYRMYVQPMAAANQDGPLTIVVFRDLHLEETMNLQILSLISIMFSLYAGAITIALVATNWISEQRRGQNLVVARFGQIPELCRHGDGKPCCSRADFGAFFVSASSRAVALRRLDSSGSIARKRGETRQAARLGSVFGISPTEPPQAPGNIPIRSGPDAVARNCSRAMSLLFRGSG